MIVDVNVVGNPWMPAPDPDEDEQAVIAVPARPAPAELGPQQETVAAPAEGLGWLDAPRGASVYWVGAHGGAGESSLEALMQGSVAMGHAWPHVADDAEGLACVVLVARTHARGMRSAQLAATQWASGQVAVRLVGLVLVADAPGRLPRTLRHQAHVVGGGVPHMWRVPWVEAWRLGEPVSAQSAPEAVMRVLDDVRQAADTATADPN